jgi:hypothetical protein
MSAAKGSEVTPQLALKRRARGQLSMLLAQLLLGMAVNLIGEPMQAAGLAKIASAVFLILHILIGIGLLAGAILVAVNAGRAEPSLAGLAWIGFAVVIVTFAAGVLTMITNSGWWSYLMAAGATALLVIYGMLFVRPGQSKTAA